MSLSKTVSGSYWPLLASNAPLPGALKGVDAVPKGSTQVSDAVYRKNHNMGLGIEILVVQ